MNRMTLAKFIFDHLDRGQEFSLFIEDHSDGAMTAICVDGHVNLLALADSLIESGLL